MKLFTVLALAAGALAATSKPFKIGVIWPDKTLYLTESGAGSKDISQAMTCTLNGGSIACGPRNLGLDYGDMHTQFALTPTAIAPNNKGWSIKPDNTISWKTSTGQDVHFSHGLKRPFVDYSNTIYAEICSVYGHPDGPSFVPGTPKAYYV